MELPISPPCSPPVPPPPLFFYKGSIDKSLLETNQVFVATAGGWSAAMAGRKTVKDSVRVRAWMEMTLLSDILHFDENVFERSAVRYFPSVGIEKPLLHNRMCGLTAVHPPQNHWYFWG